MHSVVWVSVGQCASEGVSGGQCGSVGVSGGPWGSVGVSGGQLVLFSVCLFVILNHVP